jgi:cytochrome c-type biogenesis protein
MVGAFVAGLAMFLAPCTLPIVPGYLAFIAGGREAGRRALVRNAIAFVLGFSVVFIVLGLFAVAIGHALGAWRLLVPQVAGGILLLFGLVMLGVRIPTLSMEHHARLPGFLQVGRVSSSVLIGALFALGWSPCIGPLLGTILLVASASATAVQGALLLAIFSLGLGVPFIVCALLIDAAAGAVAKLGQITGIFNTLGAVLLVATGFIMLIGKAGLFVEWGQQLLGPLYDSLLKFL